MQNDGGISSHALDPNYSANRSIPKKKPTICPGLYQGVVASNLLPNNIVEVRLDQLDHTVTCVWVAGFFSQLHGFNLSYVPTMATPVVVWVTGKDVSYIVGSIPSKLIDPRNQERYAVDPDTNYQTSKQFQSQRLGINPPHIGHKPPVDLVEGEIDLSNCLGVAITLLQNMAAIGAGDRAKIEAHVLNDMVRIISDTFRHYSAFGDYSISNDGGRLNVVWNGTSLDHEAWGNVRPTDPKAGLDKGEVNFEKVSESDDGRWRFSQFVGWLGNFVNIFLTDPVASLGRLANSSNRSGRARIHVNNDGSILLQSVTEIALEKVVRIPVPMPLRREEDPQGNRSDADVPHPEYLQTWNSEAPLDEMVYQLRAYARWLSNSYALARFRQMNRDWKVPAEDQVPAPQVNGDEADKAAINGNTQNFRLAYCAYRIFRDGSILHIDAYGNAWVSGKHGLQISSTTDVLIQAAGSVNIVAGRDINLLARKNIGLTAVLEKIRIKGQTGLQMLSAAGHMVFDVLGSFVAKFTSTVNIADAVQLDKSGKIDAILDITALRFAATTTRVNDSIVPHDGHIFLGAPAVTSVDEEFLYQDEYGADLYETLSQQWIAEGDIIGNFSSWSFSDNEVDGKGWPWPGVHVAHKAFRGGESLQRPATSVASVGPEPALQTINIQLACQ